MAGFSEEVMTELGSRHWEWHVRRLSGRREHGEYRQRGQHDLRRGRRLECSLMPDEDRGVGRDHYVLGIVFCSSYRDL